MNNGIFSVWIFAYYFISRFLLSQLKHRTRYISEEEKARKKVSERKSESESEEEKERDGVWRFACKPNE